MYITSYTTINIIFSLKDYFKKLVIYPRKDLPNKQSQYVKLLPIYYFPNQQIMTNHHSK